jgi:hypothetical protein
MNAVITIKSKETMFNPFAPFDPRLLGSFRQKGVRIFVKQTYRLEEVEFEGNQQPSFLLTHFTNSSEALKHYGAISKDPNRQLFSVDDPESWRQLASMVNKPSGQRFYTSLTIKNVNQKAKLILDTKVRTYIRTETNWRPGRHEQVSFSLDFIFGEIYVVLGYQSSEIKVKLTELERQPSYVL